MKPRTARNLVTLALFAFSLASTLILSDITIRLMAEAIPAVKAALGFMPIIVVFSVILSFFLFTRITKVLSAIFLYRYDLELDAKRLQYSMYLSTAIPSAYSLIYGILLRAGAMRLDTVSALTVSGLAKTFKAFLSYDLPIGVPLALAQAGICFLFWRTKGDADRNRKLLLSFGLAFLVYWAVGVALRLGIAFLLPS
jgi:hypothetical protein